MARGSLVAGKISHHHDSCQRSATDVDAGRPGTSSAGAIDVFGISSGFLAVITVVQIADTVAAQERGLAFGMRTTLMRACSFTGQLAFGTLAEITSIGLSFFGMGLLGVIGAITLLTLSSRSSPKS